jgi:hypothetical protein
LNIPSTPGSSPICLTGSAFLGALFDGFFVFLFAMIFVVSLFCTIVMPSDDDLVAGFGADRFI